MKRWLGLAPILLGFWAVTAHAQVVGPSCGSSQNPCAVSGTVTTTPSATSTPLTPAAPAGAILILTAGGASQNLANANACPNFIYIQNGLSTADQGGIAAVEPIYVNLTGNAASATPGGQSLAIYPGTTPIFVAQTTSIKWVAATTGHAINAWCE